VNSNIRVVATRTVHIVWRTHHAAHDVHVDMCTYLIYAYHVHHNMCFTTCDVHDVTRKHVMCVVLRQATCTRIVHNVQSTRVKWVHNAHNTWCRHTRVWCEYIMWLTICAVHNAWRTYVMCVGLHHATWYTCNAWRYILTFDVGHHMTHNMWFAWRHGLLRVHYSLFTVHY